MIDEREDLPATRWAVHRALFHAQVAALGQLLAIALGDLGRGGEQGAAAGK